MNPAEYFKFVYDERGESRGVMSESAYFEKLACGYREHPDAKIKPVVKSQDAAPEVPKETERIVHAPQPVSVAVHSSHKKRFKYSS